MTLYEKLAEIQHMACECADTQISLINDMREDSPSAKFRVETMQYYIDNAYALGLVMDNLPVGLVEREI